MGEILKRFEQDVSVSNFRDFFLSTSSSNLYDINKQIENLSYSLTVIVYYYHCVCLISFNRAKLFIQQRGKVPENWCSTHSFTCSLHISKAS